MVACGRGEREDPYAPPGSTHLDVPGAGAGGAIAGAGAHSTARQEWARIPARSGLLGLCDREGVVDAFLKRELQLREGRNATEVDGVGAGAERRQEDPVPVRD